LLHPHAEGHCAGHRESPSALAHRLGLEPRGVEGEGTTHPAIGRAVRFIPRRLHACIVLLHSGPLGRPTTPATIQFPSTRRRIRLLKPRPSSILLAGTVIVSRAGLRVNISGSPSYPASVITPSSGRASRLALLTGRASRARWSRIAVATK
jgi:hypothetical protein